MLRQALSGTLALRACCLHVFPRLSYSSSAQGACSWARLSGTCKLACPAMMPRLLLSSRVQTSTSTVGFHLGSRTCLAFISVISASPVIVFDIAFTVPGIVLWYLSFDLRILRSR